MYDIITCFLPKFKEQFLIADVGLCSIKLGKRSSRSVAHRLARKRDSYRLHSLPTHKRKLKMLRRG